jgi:hypothetical protein
MWLSALKQERLALAMAYKALTGLDLNERKLTSPPHPLSQPGVPIAAAHHAEGFS